ncbi:hypothetical protein [Laceyella putida]|uniref:Uncharacterized protein n=1 Tax=Laceyella putida TaxID=110101 RepID=A0ABW2RR28_9BACL
MKEICDVEVLLEMYRRGVASYDDVVKWVIFDRLTDEPDALVWKWIRDKMEQGVMYIGVDGVTKKSPPRRQAL